MDVRRTIAELTSQLSEINYESDEDNLLLKGVIDDDLPQEINPVEIESSNLRKRNHQIALPEQVYGGKETTREKTFSLEETSDNDSEELDIREDNLTSISEDDGIIDYESGEEESNEERDSDEAYSSGSGDGKSGSPSIGPDNRTNEGADCKIYSSKSKNIPSDIQKGIAIRNQLSIWDILLECRIKLQKVLSVCNTMPTKEKLVVAKSYLEQEDKKKLNKCIKDLLELLDKILKLQNILQNQCHVFKTKTDTSSSNLNIEIPSDESEIENDIVEDQKEGNYDPPPMKKRKLRHYSECIQNRHKKLTPLRNAVIQKWNDKTKVSSGKMASSNFSAFDQSILKQIEQIMMDKVRLINRTKIKRSNDQKNSQDIQDTEMDTEIFDDTDFYHKLLRDFIERKSTDVITTTQTERQMLELQKLRSKMKKNVDTKSTKGRKLRYTVMPKLVNFMAPDLYNTWTDEAEVELYRSLFGKMKI